MLSDGYHLRRLTDDDVQRGAALSQSVGWSQTAADWERSIAWGGEGSLGIAYGDQLAASAIAITYSPALAWIGLVITHADHQRRGLARAIMQATMENLKNRGVQTVMLDASTLGYPLYLSMGYTPLYEVRTWVGKPKLATKPEAVRAMTQADLFQITALDAHLLGAPRPQILTGYFEEGRGWVIESQGQITGYAFTKPHGQVTRIGPWYAPSPAEAEWLLHAGAAVFQDQTLRIDIPQPNADASTLAERLGLEKGRAVTRMVYGGDAPGDMAKQYAIASFGTG
ncbi:MAG: GNAT family N-acetyltransferase [Anaerolineae bacterium]|nr:GNAT family N-acetyltransferase [Anaerolineae bacterium]